MEEKEEHVLKHACAHIRTHTYAVLLRHQAPFTLAAVCPLRGSGLFEEVVCDLSSAPELPGRKESHMC